MENIKTWADFGALSKDELDALSPEEVETLKTSISENEANLAEERKTKDDELVKAKEIAENQRIRAEKAEKAKKEDKGDKENLSLSDIRALSDVHDEDVQEIVDYAKFKGVTIAEAKKTSAMQNYLSTQAEERRTAAVADTRGGQRATTINNTVILEKAKRGELSEKEEDIDKLVEARMEAKLKK